MFNRDLRAERGDGCGRPANHHSTAPLAPVSSIILKIMIYKFKSLLFTLTLILLMSTFTYGQFSRNDAIDLVLNTILTDNIGDVDVYASNNSFTTDVELIDNDSESNPYTSSWVFFSDDNPFASWYHESRVVFVSSSNGDYSIENVSIYPKYLSIDYEEVSIADRPEPISMDGTPFVPDPQKVESNYNYAET